ncbi:hypothetical protein [Halomonas sp. BC04]|uniref:hypothetical protein n=1 Tax=Halomonas sp. BC04 TaxID=1403540 RepID=UPI0012DBF218|nr:hypothetical protein [Halomonas sp. BC04]
MNKQIVKTVRKILSSVGLSIYAVNESFVDFRYQFPDPRIAAVYYKPVVMMAKVKDARWKANGSAIDHTHPIVKILRQAADSSDRSKFEKLIRNQIFDYYADYQPSGLWECIGINYSSKFDELPLPSHTNNPPWPWSLYTYLKDEKSAVIKNGKLVKSLAKEHGVQHWGPSSRSKIEAEIWKFGRLFESIRRNGFIDSPSHRGGFVEADVLVNNEGDWRWMIEQGQHRVMMCAVLDIAEINIKVRRVLTEEAIEYFPHVISGLYSLDQAGDIFHRVIGKKNMLVSKLQPEENR